MARVTGSVDDEEEEEVLVLLLLFFELTKLVVAWTRSVEILSRSN